MQKVLMVLGRNAPAQAYSRSLYYNGIIPMVSYELNDGLRLCSYSNYDLVVLDFSEDETTLRRAIHAFKEIGVKTLAIVDDLNPRKAEGLFALGCSSVIARPSQSEDFVKHLTDPETLAHSPLDQVSPEAWGA